RNIETLGQRFSAVSQALGDAHQTLTRIGQSDGIWQGVAAQAFQNTVGELPAHLDKAHQSLGEASRALQLWHTDLASMQQRAAALEAKAREALRALEQAQASPDLGLAGQYFPDAGSLQAAQQRLDAALAAVRAAETELETVREQARRLLAQHSELADEVARALDRARDIAPEEPGFFERLGETLGRALDDAVEGIRDSLVALAEASWQLVEDNANLIAAVSDVLADLSTIVGVAGDVAGIVPTPVTLGIDVALNAVSLGLQGAALGGHLLAREAGADVHAFTIAMDAYGLASGAVGLIPGPTGLYTDAAGLGLQGGVELGSRGEVPTFWGDLGDYWVPKNPVQAGLYAANAAVPGFGLAVPFWNAIEQGHRRDTEARGEGG
ncbi:MAG: hypothetical protein M3308_05685, partial [Actinomycetota bacterium]|nr:hypothetical protein [Actinomycetota bacterium]